MKKIKYLLIAILLLPLFIKADGGGPLNLSFDAVVSNPNGAALYLHDYDDNDEETLVKTSKVLKFQKRLKIAYENEFNGKKYGGYEACEEVYDEELEDYEEDCFIYYVDLDNLSIDKDEYTLKDLNKYLMDYEGGDNSIDSEASRIYIDRENVKLRKGPSSLYKEYDSVVEVGSIYKVEVEISEWLYISNGTNKGWIPSEEDWFLDYGKKVWVLDDSQTYSKIDTKNEGVIIPANTKFDSSFIHKSYTLVDEDYIFKSYYLVNYNNEYVIITDEDAAESFKEETYYYDGEYHLTPNMLTMYQIYGYKDSFDTKTNVKVPNNTKIEVLYEYRNRLYVKYNDNYAWILDSEDFAIPNDNFYSKVLTVGDFKLYDKYDGKQTKEIGPNVELEIAYYFLYPDDEDYDDEAWLYNPDWYAVKYDNKYYWFNSHQYYADNYEIDEDEEDDGYILLDKEKAIYSDIFEKDSKDHFDSGEKVKILYYFWDDVYEYKKSINDFSGCVENDNWEAEKSNQYSCNQKWYLVDNGTKTGWILAVDNEMQEIADKIIEKLEEKEEEKENQEPEKIVIEKKKLSTNELIYICAFGALALCVVAIVTIKLVNKNKNKKDTKGKEETKVDDTKIEVSSEETTPEVNNVEAEEKEEVKVEETVTTENNEVSENNITEEENK